MLKHIKQLISNKNTGKTPTTINLQSNNRNIVFDETDNQINVIVDGQTVISHPKCNLEINITGDGNTVHTVIGNIHVQGDVSKCSTTSGDINVVGDIIDAKSTSGDITASRISNGVTTSGDIIHTR
ncbi:MAG: hypothetical protein ACRDD8_14175 [Bacteroidales bacterium]